MKSSDNVSFEKATNEEKEHRLSILTEVLEEAHNRKDIINESYLLYHMNLKGIQNYNRSKLIRID